MKCDFCGQEIKKPAYVDHNGVVFCRWCYKGTFEDSRFSEPEREVENED